MQLYGHKHHNCRNDANFRKLTGVSPLHCILTILAFTRLFSQFYDSLSYQVLRQRTFLLFQRKNPSGAKFAVRLPHLHQNLLIAKDLTVKSLAIFFLQCLQLQALTAFLRRAGNCCSQRSTIPATAFCTTFPAKVSETRWTQVLGTLLLIINNLQNRYSKDLVYQIDGAKVGFPPLLLRLSFCQSEVLICSFACFADASYRI